MALVVCTMVGIMSLVVVRKTAVSIQILSDTKLTDASRRLNPLQGVLKSIALHPSLCISFAGNTALALDAVRTLDKEIQKGFSPGDVLNSLAAVSLKGEEDEDLSVDFIVAIINGTQSLHRISRGNVETDSDATWIGNDRAFSIYQENFHQKSETPLTSNLNESLQISIRMRDAFRAVIDSHVATVGDFMVSISSRSSDRHGFHYLEYAGGFDFQPVASTTEETSLLRPKDAEQGGYNYTVLTPRKPGLGAIGVHLLQPKLGAFFFPVQRMEPFLYHNVTAQEFVSAVENEFGIQIDGPRW